MSIDRDAMYAAFEAEPCDLAGYGAMADHLDELGYEALGYAFRWMQRRGKWPHKRTHYSQHKASMTVLEQGRKVPGRFRWAWYAADEWKVDVKGIWPAAPLILHSLDRLLLPGEQKVYASHQAAVMDLAEWLKKLRDVYALDEAKPAGL